MSRFYESLPKAELHAHLSGSLTFKTIQELVELHQKTFPNEALPAEADAFKKMTQTNTSFDATYAIFRVAQSIVVHPDAVRIAAIRVIEEFCYDNVKFLELRSTPRSVPGKMTKIEYVEAIVAAIENCSERKLPIVVKYLVSIDRRECVADAQEAVQLCVEMNVKHPNIVVGIDFSGDARVNNALDYLDVLQSAKEQGLFVTVHLAEVPNVAEVTDFLNSKIRPHRIGHGSCIHHDFGGDQSLWDLFSKMEPPIPVEICLTSNLICSAAQDDTNISHHVQALQDSNLPFVICTDDKGVFNCQLSSEFQRAKNVLKISERETFELSKRAIQFAFASDEEKIKLTEIWNNFERQYFPENV